MSSTASNPKQPDQHNYPADHDLDTHPPPRITRGRRDVVTAIIQRHSDNQILLLQRSDKVGTYKLHWGGISGGVEGDRESLLHRAYQEIEEETGLHASQLDYIRSGRPLYVDDDPYHFAVHPFLFKLKENKETVALNWENIDFSFSPIDTISSLKTVPKLKETIERVILSRQQEIDLERIIKDREHGAAEIGLWALDALQEEIERLYSTYTHPDEEEATSMLHSIRNFSYHLSTCRPSMAPLATCITNVLSTVHNQLHDQAGAFGITVNELYRKLKKAIEFEKERMESSFDRVQHHASQLIACFPFHSHINNRGGTHDGNDVQELTVMTISKSSMIHACISNALQQQQQQQGNDDIIRNKISTIIVCESRPLCEGVDAAKNWAIQGGAHVTLITDAQAAIFIQKGVDVVLLGADAIRSNGIVNKSGSHLLALAAKEKNVPVFVLADTSKISAPVYSIAHGDTGHNIEEEEKEVEEVVQSWPSLYKEEVALLVESGSVQVHNIYFEETPLGLIDGVVTEDGILDSHRIQEIVDERTEAVKNAFRLL